jgi:hypothetical protein
MPFVSGLDFSFLQPPPKGLLFLLSSSRRSVLVVPAGCFLLSLERAPPVLLESGLDFGSCA